MVAVLNPFPNITDHVVDAEAIRRKGPHGSGFSVAVVATMAAIVDISEKAGLCGL